MKTHRGILALGKGMLLVLACCLPVQAREATLNVTRLPQEFGLSALTPRAILQDRAGFLWFGTEDGLYKYDGYTAKQQNGLGRVAITALYQDDSGVIWLGAKDGLRSGPERREIRAIVPHPRPLQVEPQPSGDGTPCGPYPERRCWAVGIKRRMTWTRD